MNPEAPPSSQLIRSTSRKSSKATPADSTAQGPVTTSATRRHASGDPGYSSLSRSQPSSSIMRADSTMTSERSCAVSVGCEGMA